jgi:hypothetical protein
VGLERAEVLRVIARALTSPRRPRTRKSSKL